MNEPRTKAGDELLTDMIRDHEAPSYRMIERVRQGVLDIEAELLTENHVHSMKCPECRALTYRYRVLG